MTRIYGKKIDLDATHVREFFERRGGMVSSAHPLTSVMYQDQNPELAERRDIFEKTRVIPLLDLSPGAVVLDIGCGIGRWADALVGKIYRYHGIDFSESLVGVAWRRNNTRGVSFQVLAAQDLNPSILNMIERPSHVLIAGVLIYLNDADLERTLVSVAGCCAEATLVYIREPVARVERLTLADFVSKELQSTYNAIYRTEAELLDAFRTCLSPFGFRVTLNEQLYPEDMNNRSETAQRIFMLQRP